MYQLCINSRAKRPLTEISRSRYSSTPRNLTFLESYLCAETLWWTVCGQMCEIMSDRPKTVHPSTLLVPRLEVHKGFAPNFSKYTSECMPNHCVEFNDDWLFSWWEILNRTNKKQQTKKLQLQQQAGPPARRAQYGISHLLCWQRRQVNTSQACCEIGFQEANFFKIFNPSFGGAWRYRPQNAKRDTEDYDWSSHKFHAHQSLHWREIYNLTNK